MSFLSRFRILSILLLSAALLSGCDAFSSDDDEGGKVTLQGQILNQQTNNPITNSFVRVLPFDLLFEADSLGGFSFEVDIDSTMDLQVVGNADGFQSNGIIVLAIAGRTVTVPDLSLFPIADAPATSGRPSNIILLQQSASSIGVQESGSMEQASFTFLLADSLGQPVVLDQKVEVNFRFGAQPGGGELFSPASAETDNNGIVTAVVSSGTRSGVVQIVAEANVDGRVIRSQPVALTIHGGLPDQAHFSLGPALRNFPGLNLLGMTNGITVIVGDKYSNPVREGTAVYFHTDHGVIEGSTLTGPTGFGGVNLISANPLPADGVAHVTANTVDDSQTTVSSVTPVLFTGTPSVSVSPGTARVNQVYSLEVTDYNGNPLAKGTSISVSAVGTAIQVGGTTNTTLDDTAFLGGIDYQHVVRGPGITEFTFVVAEDIDPDNPEVPAVEAITIAVTGPNGALELVLTPGGIPMSETEGVMLRQAANGGVSIALDERAFELR